MHDGWNYERLNNQIFAKQCYFEPITLLQVYFICFSLEDLPNKVRSLVKNPKKVQAELVAVKISYLKKINKGSNIVILDSWVLSFSFLHIFKTNTLCDYHKVNSVSAFELMNTMFMKWSGTRIHLRQWREPWRAWDSRIAGSWPMASLEAKGGCRAG